MKYSLRTFKNVILFASLFYKAIINSVTRALSRVVNLPTRGPLHTVEGPLANTKKTWEMTVSTDVDS